MGKKITRVFYVTVNCFAPNNMKQQAKLICVFSSTLLVRLEKLVLPVALDIIFQSAIFDTTESQSQACTKYKT